MTDQELGRQLGMTKKQLKMLDHRINDLAIMVNKKRGQGVMNSKLETDFSNTLRKARTLQNKVAHLERMYQNTKVKK